MLEIVDLITQSSPPDVLLEKGILKICSKFTGEHPCRSVISIKLSNFIEIKLQHGCSPVNLLHIFSILFPKNTSGGLLLNHKFTENDLDLFTFSRCYISTYFQKIKIILHTSTIDYNIFITSTVWFG